jgi:hypothetical protein
MIAAMLVLPGAFDYRMYGPWGYEVRGATRGETGLASHSSMVLLCSVCWASSGHACRTVGVWTGRWWGMPRWLQLRRSRVSPPPKRPPLGPRFRCAVGRASLAIERGDTSDRRSDEVDVGRVASGSHWPAPCSGNRAPSGSAAAEAGGRDRHAPKIGVGAGETAALGATGWGHGGGGGSIAPPFSRNAACVREDGDRETAAAGGPASDARGRGNPALGKPIRAATYPGPPLALGGTALQAAAAGRAAAPFDLGADLADGARPLGVAFVPGGAAGQVGGIETR